MLLPEIIRGRLTELRLRSLKDDYDRESAVLMPIFEEGGQPHFLLTRRTEEVATHKGQISFPGGMRHGEESLTETALRETEEEVGIGRDQFALLGRFHDYLSITAYRVVPFVAYLETPFSPSPQAREVAEVLQVPFEIFYDPGRLKVERMFRQGKWTDVYYYRYGVFDIWGLTARIIRDFLQELRLGGDAPAGTAG